jgi:hypothetical protein
MLVDGWQVPANALCRLQKRIPYVYKVDTCNIHSSAKSKLTNPLFADVPAFSKSAITHFCTLFRHPCALSVQRAAAPHALGRPA